MRVLLEVRRLEVGFSSVVLIFFLFCFLVSFFLFFG